MVNYKLSRKCKNDTTKKSRISPKQPILKQKTALYKKCNKQRGRKQCNIQPSTRPNIKINRPYIYDRETIPQVERNLICYNQQWSCNLCSEMFKCSIIIDHIRPLFLGGSNSLNNYQGLCDVCNKIKTDVIDKKIYKSYITGEVDESELTTVYILNKQNSYFNSKEYSLYI